MSSLRLVLILGFAFIVVPSLTVGKLKERKLQGVEIRPGGGLGVLFRVLTNIVIFCLIFFLAGFITGVVIYATTSLIIGDDIAMLLDNLARMIIAYCLIYFRETAWKKKITKSIVIQSDDNVLHNKDS